MFPSQLCVAAGVRSCNLNILHFLLIISLPILCVTALKQMFFGVWGRVKAASGCNTCIISHQWHGNIQFCCVFFFFTLEENRNSTKRKRKKKEPHHIVCSYLEALVQNNLLSSWGWATEEGVERGWRIRSLTANLGEPKSLYRSPPGGTAGLRTGGRWAARFNQPAMRLASNPDLQICKHRCHTSPFPQSSGELFFFFFFLPSPLFCPLEVSVARSETNAR